MSKYSEYEYRKQPGFDMSAFEGATCKFDSPSTAGFTDYET